MVRVLLRDTGQQLDTKGVRLRYVKQAADFGQITKINTSYSWSMQFPKSPTNTGIFEGLGIAGDQSNAPYRKLYCDVIDNGIPVVRKGLLKITDTDGYYKAFVQDGIIEFFTDISTDKVSEVIDLSGLDHENTVANIIASFTNPHYRYNIASYNGPPLANQPDGTTDLNPFALAPSINVEYLWDLIFEHYGWTYSGDLDLTGFWMTYPNAITFSDTGNTVILTATAQAAEFSTVGDADAHLAKWTTTLLDAAYLTSSPAPDYTTFTFQQAGNFRVRFNMEGFFIDTFPPVATPYKAKVTVNGIDVGEYSISDEDTVVVTDIVANIGTQLQITVYNPTDQGGTIHVFDSSTLSIETLGVTTISFSQALIKYKVAEFFKEILTRQALVPFADIEDKNIRLVSLDNLLEAQSLDWSDRFVTRTKESYVFRSYAQSNYLRHKYENEEEDTKDGILRVDNANLQIEKTLYASKTYAPEEELAEYSDNGSPYFVPIFKMFNVEVKEDPATGDLLADYKPQKDRFYIYTAETVTRDLYILGVAVTSFPMATANGNTFDDIVATKYANINSILDKTRIHRIELALSKWDVATLDLSKRYYFKQEKAHYLINKLTWQTGNKSIAECIRLT